MVISFYFGWPTLFMPCPEPTAFESENDSGLVWLNDMTPINPTYTQRMRLRARNVERDNALDSKNAGAIKKAVRLTFPGSAT